MQSLIETGTLPARELGLAIPKLGATPCTYDNDQLGGRRRRRNARRHRGDAGGTTLEARAACRRRSGTTEGVAHLRARRHPGWCHLSLRPGSDRCRVLRGVPVGHVSGPRSSLQADATEQRGSRQRPMGAAERAEVFRTPRRVGVSGPRAGAPSDRTSSLGRPPRFERAPRGNRERGASSRGLRRPTASAVVRSDGEAPRRSALVRAGRRDARISIPVSRRLVAHHCTRSRLPRFRSHVADRGGRGGQQDDD
jgi:hypothetical protein